MSQTQQILDYMKAGNSITPLEALSLFGCMRLASRIYDIRKTKTVKAGKVTENGKTYARYSLRG